MKNKTILSNLRAAMLLLLLLVGSNAFAAEPSGKTTGLLQDVYGEKVTLKLGSGSAGKEYNLVGRYFITASQSLVGGFAHAIFTPDYVTLASKMGCAESTLKTYNSYWFPVPNADYKETNEGNWLNENGEKTGWDNGVLDRYFIQIDNGNIWFGQYPSKYPSGSSVDGTIYLVSTNQECNNVVEIKYIFNFVPSATTYHRFVADYVDIGNSVSEGTHNFRNTEDSHGDWSGQTYRHVGGGKWFSYDLSLANVTHDMKDKVSLVIRYWGSDRNSRYFSVIADDVILRNQLLDANNAAAFIEYEYPVDRKLVEGKEKLTIKFRGIGMSVAGGIFYVKLVTGYDKAARQLPAYTFEATDFERNANVTITSTADNVISMTGTAQTDFNLNLRMKPALGGTKSIMPNQYLLVMRGTGFTDLADLWWILGTNHNTGVRPTVTKVKDGVKYLVWDLRKSRHIDGALKIWGNEEIPAASNFMHGEYAVSGTKWLTSYDMANAESYYYYKLTTKNSENFGFYWGNGDGSPFSMTSNERAYLVLPQTMAQQVRSFVFDDIETSISAIKSSNNATSVYDLSGRCFDKGALKHGVYIVNGKKIIK